MLVRKGRKSFQENKLRLCELYQGVSAMLARLHPTSTSPPLFCATPPPAFTASLWSSKLTSQSEQQRRHYAFLSLSYTKYFNE